jgi:hypothetical protein
VTAFSDWYAANVKPQLEESLARLPAQAREPLRTASRQAMAACWNAALDAAEQAKYESPSDSATEISARLRV